MIRCNNCFMIFDTDEDLTLLIDDEGANAGDPVYYKGCPSCKTDAYLMDMQEAPMTIKRRLAYLRKEILAERISYSELNELQNLAEHIDRGDVLLLEWAGVEEVRG